MSRTAALIWNRATVVRDLPITAGPESILNALRHCGDTHFVTIGDGKTHQLWELNLRFKADISESGPNPGKPVIIGAGMRGNRASAVFSGPAELGGFIKAQCG